MASLGGTTADLQDFYSHYASRLQRRRSPRFKMTRANWRGFLGSHENDAEFVDFFATELRQLGLEKLLLEYVPSLAHGLAASGLHGLIRTAYGIEIGHGGEIVEGLALWANGFLPLAVHAPRISYGMEPLEVLAKLRERERRRATPVRAPDLTNAMVEIDADPEFGALATSVDLGAGGLSEIARLTRLIYATKQDFASLHMITGMHAMRLVMPYVDDSAAAVRAFWVAIGAIYVKIGCPEFDVSPVTPTVLPDWREISDRAINSRDDHVMKLVHACRRDADYYQRPMYRWLAAREVGCVQDAGSQR
jgi:hypothetical protein